MANTMDKLRELLARAVPFLCDEGAKYADDGNNEPLELAREIDAILRESEAQGDAGAVEALITDLVDEAYQEGKQGRPAWGQRLTDIKNDLICRLAASATPRAEPAEGREAVGADDSITLTDVADVLGEIAEGFDGGEYAITDETRRVLIDFAHGIPEHPLFNVVGHYFAQNPVPGTTPPAGDGAPWRPMETAPRDGTLVRLLVEFTENARTALRVIEQSSRELAVHAHTLREHIAALAAREPGDCARVTDEDARAVRTLVNRIDLDFVPGMYGDLGAAIEAAEPALRRIAALAAREGGAP